MAITDESQILSKSKVNESLAFLEKSFGYVSSAIGELNGAKSYCGPEVFAAEGNNTFPKRIETIVSGLEDLLTTIANLKENISTKADNIIKDEKDELKKYKEEQEKSKNESKG